MLNFPYHLLAEWLCFAASILLLRRVSPKFWLWIKGYLLIVVCVETICHNVRDNNWIYNLFSPIEFCFGIWIISQIIPLKKTKPVIIVCYGVYMISYLIELTMHGGSLKDFFDKTCTIGSVIMIGLCMLYYYHTLFLQETYVDLLRHPVFWLISGYFIYYTTTIGFDTFFNQLKIIQLPKKVPIGAIIMYVLNIVLYSFWIVSFICLKNTRKFTPPLLVQP